LQFGHSMLFSPVRNHLIRFKRFSRPYGLFSTTAELHPKHSFTSKLTLSYGDDLHRTGASLAHIPGALILDAVHNSRHRTYHLLRFHFVTFLSPETLFNGYDSFPGSPPLWPSPRLKAFSFPSNSCSEPRLQQTNRSKRSRHCPQVLPHQIQSYPSTIALQRFHKSPIQ
jgi:hypothetical protein